MRRGDVHVHIAMWGRTDRQIGAEESLMLPRVQLFVRNTISTVACTDAL